MARSGTAAVYDRLFAIRRDLPAAIWIRRAMAQNRAQDIAGAIDSYREAARLDPDAMQVYLHLGTLYIQQRSFAEADAALRRALELDPGNRYALSMLAHTRQRRCTRDGLAELFAQLRDRLEGEDADTEFAVVPFAALAMPLSSPSDTTRLPPGPSPSRAAGGLPESGFVFCCDPARLIFAPIVKIGEHVARNAVADLFLDSYPYGAHTTANDALLAGLPVLTCTGETMVSRIAGSQLNAIGLPELIAENVEQYEARALERARRPELLRGYRARLAANRSTHPLFDMARYACDFEDAMERLWSDHSGKAPV
jgi:hypothetical protein